MLKYSILLFCSLLLGKSVMAQDLKGYNNLELSIGHSLTHKTQLLTLSYSRESPKFLSFGIGAQAINYSLNNLYNETKGPTNDKIIVGGGLFAKFLLGSTRNYNSYLKLSGYLGSDQEDYIYWPELSYNHSFFLSKHIKLNAGAYLQYFFQKKLTNKYNPGLQIGLSFIL